MAKYRIDQISDLARQLCFTPPATRLLQITSAEQLLHEIDPSKAYPPEYVIFRITGYSRRSPALGEAAATQVQRSTFVAAELLTGLALQHDLGALIESLSDSLNLQTAQCPEPVLSIDDVTEKLNITSKTVQRWRRRGLPARRFFFPDGRKRVGFLLSSVERYFSLHLDQCATQINVSRVEPQELAEIAQSGHGQEEIARRIAHRVDRSPLTIVHTIRKFDQENPTQAIFPSAPEPLDDRTRARVLKGYRRGLSIRWLAARAGRPRAAIYRLILNERIEKLTRRRVRFIDDPLYHQPDAQAVVSAIAGQDVLVSSPSSEQTRTPRDLPPYLQALYRTPLLTQAQERALFLKFNFHKYQFVAARRKLDPQFARHRDLKLMEDFLHRATEVKNRIIQANLRLVASIARRHLRPGLSLMELISDGNVTLMRAIESFDAHKGNRFSTYATLSLMKGFARSVPLMQTRALPLDRLATAVELPDQRSANDTARMIERDQVDHLLGSLDESERRVLRAHYGISDLENLNRGNAREPATVEQVAAQLGLSIHRVRQIERTAIDKLRAGAARA